MSTKRLGYVAAWLAVTTLATAASFAAVDLVGATTADEPSPSLTFAVSSSAGTTQASTTTGSSLASTTTPPTTASSTTTITTTTVTSATSVATTPTTVGSTTATTVAETTTTTLDTTTTTTATETGPFSFASDGGTVTITCTGDDISLSGAIPGMGFTAEIESAGPGEVRVEFVAGETEVEVRVECEAGIPEVEIHGP